MPSFWDFTYVTFLLNKLHREANKMPPPLTPRLSISEELGSCRKGAKQGDTAPVDKIFIISCCCHPDGYFIQKCHGPVA